jgi:3-hydroxymyristoyl/3-hydroxydecanoyl-(acyl carrier protein) dehydratase
VSEAEDVAYEPIVGFPAALRCRGPVTVETQKVVYEVEISEIGYRPEPYVLADALMYADGKPIVRFTGMSMQLTGLTRQKVEARWHKPLYDAESILQFSIGDPSRAFGDRYKVFDKERRIARLPGPPFLFMDRVVEVNQPPWELKPGGWIESQYDVPRDAWYFGANHQPTMPFCVLLEAALQPCGWLAAYVGSALRSKQDMHFRNLGGTATLHRELWPEIGTIRVRVRMTDVSEAGGMIIENFDMQVLKGDEMLYEGVTNFGFFSGTALANQLGVRDARRFEPHQQGRSLVLPRLHPLTPDEQGDDSLGLPGKALLMMDAVDCWLPDSGTHGLGFIRGVKTVDPEEWFFKAHFYQDPVWPGSLGLEAFLQLLRVVAWEKWPELRSTHRVEAITVGKPHTWIYRGQVIPTNKRVEVEASITAVEGLTLTAQGYLVVDGLSIYEMKEFGIRLVPL